MNEFESFSIELLFIFRLLTKIYLVQYTYLIFLIASRTCIYSLKLVNAVSTFVCSNNVGFCI